MVIRLHDAPLCIGLASEGDIIMDRKASPLGPAHSNKNDGIIALIIFVILVLIMLWYVRYAPLPIGSFP